MKCPNCNTENAEGMKFCGECGTKLPDPMNHCPNCNKDWPLTMKFCGECGYKFGTGTGTAANTAANTAAKTSNLSIPERMELQNAKDLFYDTGNFVASFPVVKKIWDNHKEDEELLSVILPLSTYDVQTMIDFWDELGKIAVEGSYCDTSLAYGYGTVYLLCRTMQLDGIDPLFDAAKNELNVSEDDAEYMRHQALYYLALFKKYTKNEFLEKAEGLINKLPPSQDKLENTWNLLLANMLREFKGQVKKVYSEEFCSGNNIYYWFINSNVFDLWDTLAAMANTPTEQTPDD